MDIQRLLTLERMYDSWICERYESIHCLMEMYFDNSYNYRLCYYPRSLMLYAEMIDYEENEIRI